MPLDRGTGTSSALEQGTGTPTYQTSDTTSYPASSGYSGGGGYYGGGGYGGGYGSSGGQTPEDAQQEQQQTIYNLGDIYEKRAGDMGKGVQGRAKDLNKNAKQRQKDMDDVAQRQLNNILGQKDANDATLTAARRKNMQQIEWQPNQQREQSTLMALRNRMGNAALGSGIQDLREGMGRIDDMNDVSLINAWKQNEDAAYNNWFQADTSLNADYNDQVASILDSFSQFGADYQDQMSKLNWDYFDEVSRNYAQYWSQMSNINPRLATKENMNQARRNKRAQIASDNAKADLEDARSVRSEVDKMVKNLSSGQGSAALTTQSKMTPTQKKASQIIEKAAKSNKGATSEAIGKAASEAAKNSVEGAKKTYIDARAKTANPEISFGEDTDRYVLPHTDLLSRVALPNQIALGPSDALSKMLTTRESGSAQSDLTRNMIRPDHSANKGVRYDRSRQANTGFSNNLVAFRRM